MRIHTAEFVLHNVIRCPPTHRGSVGLLGDSPGPRHKLPEKGSHPDLGEERNQNTWQQGKAGQIASQAGGRKGFDRAKHDFPLSEVLQVHRSVVQCLDKCKELRSSQQLRKEKPVKNEEGVSEVV